MKNADLKDYKEKSNFICERYEQQVSYILQILGEEEADIVEMMFFLFMRRGGVSEIFSEELKTTNPEKTTPSSGLALSMPPAPV